MPNQELVFGSRRSRLALWQTNAVAEALVNKHPNLTTRIVEMDTDGDKNLTLPLADIGSKGLFTAALDAAILRGEIHLAVHSLKDLPVEPNEQIRIESVLTRAAPHDVLVSRQQQPLSELKAGAQVATSSPRRASQVLALRPDLVVAPIRGNVPTRITKVMNGEFDAAILAAAGIQRLSLEKHIAQHFSIDEIVPAPGQGALAVTYADTNHMVASLVADLVDADTTNCVACERMLLAQLGGGCSAPISAIAIKETGGFRLTGRVGSSDGQVQLTESRTAAGPHELAGLVANQLLAAGAQELLD